MLPHLVIVNKTESGSAEILEHNKDGSPEVHAGAHNGFLTSDEMTSYRLLNSPRCVFEIISSDTRQAK
jgi:hypothetical protein